MNQVMNYESALELTKRYGQEHVFRFWPSLNFGERQNLLEQIGSIDFNLLADLKNIAFTNEETIDQEIDLEPAETVSLEERQHRDSEAERVGGDALKNGEVAAFLVAGGQGSRLGLEGPKGIFPVTPVKKKSLFQVFAEKIMAINTLYQTTVPWYIMTSVANNKDTIGFFEENKFFNLNPQQIKFFNQEMIPAIDQDGKLILDASHHIFMNPNGHGGSLKALWDNEAISDMQSKGIKYIFYFQVDNVLANICDPAFLGYHILANSEMSNKVVRKTSPEEKVGIICKINGKDGVVEYSDLSEKHMYAVDNNGLLKLWSGSIATHILNVDFVEKENQSGFKLPFHLAYKSIPYLDDTGNQIKPDEKNGIKFETFVFDALTDTKKSISVEVNRKKEFSPLKNKSGTDSASTVKNDLLNFYANWFRKAGILIPNDSEGNPKYNIEISPSFALDEKSFINKRSEIPEPYNNLYLE